MNKIPYKVLPIDNSAKIILSPCPGAKGVGLEDSIAALARENIKVILTLMPDEEIIENKLLSLPYLCKQKGIEWMQLQIIDDDIPKGSFHSKWQSCHSFLLDTLRRGECIAIHCKGGTGRTGMVTAMILACLGWPTKKIIREIQNVRPKALTNKKQLAYFQDFAKQLNIQ